MQTGCPKALRTLRDVANDSRGCAPSAARRPRRPLAVTVAVALPLFAGAGSASAALAVSNCNDHGSGSLRDAVIAATNGSVIDMTQLACSTISLSTGALIVDHAVSNLTLNGPTSKILKIDGAYSGRVLVHNGEGTLTLDHLTVTHGLYASGYYGGGCIYALGSVTLQHSVVSNCTVQLGEQRFVYGGGIWATHNLVMTSSTLRDNVVYETFSNGNAKGGGAFVGGNFTATSSTISGNTAMIAGKAGAFGGGIDCNGATLVYGSTFSNNEALVGGALSTEGTVTLTNTTVTGNHALSAGGLFGSSANVTLTSTTVAFNRHDIAGAGAALMTSGTLIANSSIIANNTSTQNLADEGALVGVLITGSHNLITVANKALPVGTLTSDPKLAPLAGNGGSTRTLALKSGSPAIDTGDAGGLPFDQRGSGRPRSIGGIADIGAFEFDPDTIFVNTLD